MKPIRPDGMQMPVTTMVATCKASVAGLPSLNSIRAFCEQAMSPLSSHFQD